MVATLGNNFPLIRILSVASTSPLIMIIEHTEVGKDEEKVVNKWEDEKEVQC